MFFSMKNLFIVSMDLVGSGCDELVRSLPEAREVEKSYINHLVKNEYTGFVNVESVEVEDEDIQTYLDDPQLFFDTDDNGTRKQVSRTRVFHGVKTHGTGVPDSTIHR